jgi:hypothetical protein
MSSWVVDVITPAMAERLADAVRGPLAAAGLPGSVTSLGGGRLLIDSAGLESLTCLGWHHDGRVTAGDTGPVLHIGKDGHRVVGVPTACSNRQGCQKD